MAEAVMVLPEECETAPKHLAAKPLAPQPLRPAKSATRVVLLAVLALAAATGAMFGVVVLGNEFTKDMHPKRASGGVTLVDSEDRAVATAAVESYVSLLDLPLLGTAELNKVDGITFRTHRGIEHWKVARYLLTAESARVGDAAVRTPRLSLLSSSPGATIEVSVRDARAWISEVDEAGTTRVTEIDTPSRARPRGHVLLSSAAIRRRLADAGSCLENGACLYSRDELLRLDAASRRLEEGSFYARADVAAYQVELAGDDVLELLADDAAEAAYLDGTYAADGHRFRLRVAEEGAAPRVLFTNLTSGKSKLLTREGSFVFSDDGLLRECSVVYYTAPDAAAMGVEAVAAAMDFETFEVTRARTPKAGFLPFAATRDDCLDVTARLANLSSPEARERFPGLADAFQHPLAPQLHDQYFRGNHARKLRHDVERDPRTAALRARADVQEMIDLMRHPASGRALTREELARPDFKRRLSDKNRPIKRPAPLAPKQPNLESREKEDEECMKMRAACEKGDKPACVFVERQCGKSNQGDKKNKKEDLCTTETMACKSRNVGRRKAWSGLTHFDLWVATRLADPTFGWLERSGMLPDNYLETTVEDYTKASVDDPDWQQAVGNDADFGQMLMDISGKFGVSEVFRVWSGFEYIKSTYLPHLADYDEVLKQNGCPRGQTCTTSDLAPCHSSQSFRKLNSEDDDWFSPLESWNTDDNWDWYKHDRRDFLDNQQAEVLDEIEARRDVLKGKISMPKGLGSIPDLSSCSDQAAYDLDPVGCRRALQKSTAQGVFGIMFRGSCSGGYGYSKIKLDEGRYHQHFCQKYRQRHSDGLDMTAWVDFVPDSMGNYLKYRCEETCAPSNEAANFYAFTLMNPSSWASILYKPYSLDNIAQAKDKWEYVLAFQGTKMNDPGMFQYTMGYRQPVYVEHCPKLSVCANSKAKTIVPEGYVMYVEGLIDCIDTHVQRIMVGTYFNSEDITEGMPAKHWPGEPELGGVTQYTDPVDVPLVYVTGHSLGGAAASLYAELSLPGLYGDLSSKPWLVTFGAPPTAFKAVDSEQRPGFIKCWDMSPRTNASVGRGEGMDWCSPTPEPLNMKGLKVCPDGPAENGATACDALWTHNYMTQAGWTDYRSISLPPDYRGDPGCFAAPEESIRILHKFDPIPSDLFWLYQYRHNTEYSMLLFDASDGVCVQENQPLSCATNVWDPSEDYSPSEHFADYQAHYDVDAQRLALHDYLCTNKSVVASASVNHCSQHVYSYANALNPFPCAEVLMAYTRAYLYSRPDITVDNGMPDVWRPPEDFASCTSSFLLTVETYFKTAQASSLKSVTNATAAEEILYGLLWGLAWVHTTYPNYPLCTTYSNPTAASSDQAGATSAVALMNRGATNDDSILPFEVFDRTDPCEGCKSCSPKKNDCLESALADFKWAPQLNWQNANPFANLGDAIVGNVNALKTAVTSFLETNMKKTFTIQQGNFEACLLDGHAVRGFADMTDKLKTVDCPLRDADCEPLYKRLYCRAKGRFDNEGMDLMQVASDSLKDCVPTAYGGDVACVPVAEDASDAEREAAKAECDAAFRACLSDQHWGDVSDWSAGDLESSIREEVDFLKNSAGVLDYSAVDTDVLEKIKGSLTGAALDFFKEHEDAIGSLDMCTDSVVAFFEMLPGIKYPNWALAATPNPPPECCLKGSCKDKDRFHVKEIRGSGNCRWVAETKSCPKYMNECPRTCEACATKKRKLTSDIHSAGGPDLTSAAGPAVDLTITLTNSPTVAPTPRPTVSFAPTSKVTCGDCTMELLGGTLACEPWTTEDMCYGATLQCIATEMYCPNLDEMTCAAEGSYDCGEQRLKLLRKCIAMMIGCSELNYDCVVQKVDWDSDMTLPAFLREQILPTVKPTMVPNA